MVKDKVVLEIVDLVKWLAADDEDVFSASSATSSLNTHIIIIIIISLQSYRQECLLTDLHVLTNC